jgi:hypothetical protein
MGRLYAFECAKCGFTARVSGGVDRGHLCFTQTVLCRDCKTLRDVATHVRLSRPPFPKLAATARLRLKRAIAKVILPAHVGSSGEPARHPAGLGDLLLPGSDLSRWVALEVSCPAANAHRFRLWRHPGPCPRCGTFLDKTITPALVWE